MDEDEVRVTSVWINLYSGKFDRLKIFRRELCYLGLARNLNVVYSISQFPGETILTFSIARKMTGR